MLITSQTMRDVLKRKLAEDEDLPSSSSSSPPSSLSSPASSEWESDGEISSSSSSSSSDHQEFTPHSPPSHTSPPTVRSILKRQKLSGAPGSVRFDQVTVFSFPRCQGFSSVPSRGGSTLGMVQRHSSLQSFSLAQHAVERRQGRREKLRERRRREKLKALRHNLVSSGAVDQRQADRLTVDQIPDEDVHISDSELEDGSFLQPFSSRQRQALLQAAGVKRVEREEKRQLQELRLSREACGCDCPGFCEPETCACSLAGIKCQVDRFSFPCGCTKDGCGNTQGRIEFNSRRVQTHYIHTVMKLELERRLQLETLSEEDQADQTGLPEDLEEFPVEREESQRAEDRSCPFGFSLEEDGLPLTMPATPTFHFSPERFVAEEESSCSSDMTDSCCSSSDSEGCQSLPDVSLSRALSICNSENDNFSTCRHIEEPLTQHISAGDTFSDTISRSSLTDYLDENANQARGLLDDDSLEDFPNTPSPSVDYFSGRYMDLSLSSDSDIEFFDSDYTSGPLHSSFKLHRHPESLRHLQLFSSVSSLPQYESSTFLLESLIGLTEPNPEQSYAFSSTQNLL